jgi:aminopeptidase N
MQIETINLSENTLELDSIELELEELFINNIEVKKEAFIYEEDKLKIFNLPKSFSLKIKNKIYPQNNTELEGLYKSGNMFCTQNEPEGFRKITPYLDRPDVMSVFTTTIVANKEKYPVLLSNGNKSTSTMSAFNSQTHTVTWHDPHPKPAYLFALVAGDLGSISDSFTTESGKEVELNIYCDLGNESKCYHAMKSLKEAMIWDEEKYGCEYDLDIYNIVAVESFNMGAMENKGLNIFNSEAVLADNDVSTDSNFMRIQSIIAHEYFHNWTGNRITCKNWFQLTLKEGLTVFRDQCFSADLNSKEVQRIEDVKALQERQFTEDASPTAHPIQPKSYISMNNFYTSTIYEKGAEVIRMIHTLIGQENYRKAMDLYFKTFDGEAVTTDDFLWAMSEASGHNLTQFKRWYDQSGTPTIKVDEKYEDNIYTLYISQYIPKTPKGEEQKNYYFPLKIALLNDNGNEIIEQTLIISESSHFFIFKGLSAKPHLSVNRDFSAPVIVKQEKSDYAFLIKHDNNSFVKYQTLHSFAIQTLEALMQNETLNQNFIEAYGEILDLNIDLSYKALLLTLPTETALIQTQKEIDFEIIGKALKTLKQELAKTYKSKLLELYNKNHEPKANNIEPISKGKRALKNFVLELLASLESQEVVNLATEQYNNALSMSDKLVALKIIESSTNYYSSEPLENFYNKYRENKLVKTKYFGIIASSRREGLFERIEAVEQEKIYNEKVPNHLRSLIGLFANNSKYFHEKDGSGYKFMANKIIHIDSINAQVASRMVGVFTIYEKMNPHNKVLMKKELEQILSTQNLSNNLYEMVSKILKV